MNHCRGTHVMSLIRSLSCISVRFESDGENEYFLLYLCPGPYPGIL